MKTSGSTAWEVLKNLLEQAKCYMDKSDFTNALTCFTQAIAVPGLTRFHQALAFEWCSECYLCLAVRLRARQVPEWDIILDNAMVNANKAIELSNFCARAHKVLAKYYILRDKFTEAQFHCDQCEVITKTFSQYLNQVSEEMDSESGEVRTRIKTEKNGSINLPPEMTDSSKIEEGRGSDCEYPGSSSASKSKLTNQKSKVNVIKYENETGNKTFDVQLIINEATSDLQWLTQLFQKTNTFNKSDQNKIINIMYKSGTDLYKTFTFSKDMNRTLTTVITQLYKSICEKNSEVGEEDMKIRYCYAILCIPRLESSNPKAIKNFMGLVKRGVEMYPQNPYFYVLVSGAYELLKDHEGGLRYAKQALRKFPSHPELLFLKVMHLDNLVEQKGEDYEDIEKRLEAYNEYIQALPQDHWKVPKICYRIASCYMSIITCSQKGMKLKVLESEMTMIGQILHYFNRGCIAEERVHSFFQPRLRCHYKPVLINFLQSRAGLYSCQVVVGINCESNSNVRNTKVKAVNDTGSNSNVRKDDPNLQVNMSGDVQLRINEVTRDLHYLTQLFQTKNSFNKVEQKEIINIMYKSGTDVYETLKLSQDVYKKVNSVITPLYKSNCEKKSVVGEEDMKIRCCFIHLSLRETDSLGLQNSIKMAKKGSELYPANPYFHCLVCCAYNQLNDHKGGLGYVEQALKKFPNHSGLLSAKASHLDKILGKTDKEMKRVVDAINEYIQALPQDHWQVPQLCYLTALRYTYKADVSTHINERLRRERYKIMRDYFSRGIDAEKRVHSYFQLRLRREVKLEVKLFLHIEEIFVEKPKRMTLSSENQRVTESDDVSTENSVKANFEEQIGIDSKINCENSKPNCDQTNKKEVVNEPESNKSNARDSQENDRITAHKNYNKILQKETEGAPNLEEPSQLPPIGLELVKISNLLRNFQKLGINSEEYKPVCKTESGLDESVTVVSSTSTPEASPVIEPKSPLEPSNGIGPEIVCKPQNPIYCWAKPYSLPEGDEPEKNIIEQFPLSKTEVASHEFKAQPAQHNKIVPSSEKRKPAVVSARAVPKVRVISKFYNVPIFTETPPIQPIIRPETTESSVITKLLANEIESSHDAPSTNQPSLLPPDNPEDSDKTAISSEAPAVTEPSLAFTESEPVTMSISPETVQPLHPQPKNENGSNDLVYLPLYCVAIYLFIHTGLHYFSNMDDPLYFIRPTAC
ncbi:unnamed protein product [Orchesella dallaii]|uniref:Calcineurin-binding protein cabin-1 n=1 Tax=Orchesella dallaii TaxID=48710 RepID=A0ABP1RFA1_9HEXA